MAAPDIEKIISAFPAVGRVERVSPIDQGHINSSFCVTAQSGERYVLQMINRYVFKQPELVMANICAVTDHLRRKTVASGGDPEREVLTVIPAADGRSFYVDSEGEYWRMYNFISGATTYESVVSPDHLKNAGYAFGRFQTLLADFPIDTLHDTIPDFHNTRKRLDDFFAAVEADAAGRVADVAEEIEFFRTHRELASSLQNMLESGELPLRVTHNDTKYNNIMIDDATGSALCVLDLDTVMPGLSVFDYGDAIRFAAATAPEDETDLEKMGLDMALFEQFTAGFVSATTGFLSKAEMEHMVTGAIVITIELASRFLLDHINGDKYFRIHRPGHNLDRARAQIALARDMERKLPQMRAIVEKYI